MAITHTNREGAVYYLHAGRTKAGKPHYYFSMRQEGQLASAVPEGYETYEAPVSAQVFIRRIPRKLITDEELETVRRAVARLAKTPYTIIEAKDNTIIVHAADMDDADVNARLGALRLMLGAAAPDPGEARTWIERNLSYHPMLRFVLLKGAERQFRAERWCFRGSVDGWSWLRGQGDLGQLVEQYAPHLGAESFFEMW